MRILSTLAINSIALIGLVACGSVPVQKPHVAPVSTVINLVKDELQFVSDNLPNLVKTVGPGAVCKGPNNSTVVKLEPKSAKVVLKTVAVDEKDPQIGLTDPIGVISVDPSYSGAYSTGQTQTLALEFSFPPKDPNAKKNSLTDATMNDHRLAEAIISFAQSLLDVDHSKRPCLQPGTLTATATFDVVNKTTSGVTFKLWIFKLGEKRTITDEAHQTIELAYDLTKGGSTVVVPP